MTPIQQRLFALQDIPYRDFRSRLVPTLDPAVFIGVRVPDLRRVAAEIADDEATHAFLENLPHTYYEENNLHAFLICRLRDYDTAIAALDRFLPALDNWATCDLMVPGAFRRAATHEPDRLLADLRRYMHSPEPYIRRFGMKMLMTFFLDARFRTAFLDEIIALHTDHYYVRMMIAWFFATALSKQYEATLPYLEHRRLPAWTHRKAIQKALESYRITPLQKDYLRTLRSYPS